MYAFGLLGPELFHEGRLVLGASVKPVADFYVFGGLHSSIVLTFVVIVNGYFAAKLVNWNGSDGYRFAVLGWVRRPRMPAFTAHLGRLDMKRGTPDHPKLKALMVALNVEKYAAVGVLEMLWHFTARYAADGDIGGFTDEEIAAAIGWKKRSGKPKVSSGSFLVRALVDTRWLDGPYEVPQRSPRGHAEVPPRSLRVPSRCLLVHDWKDHADQTLKRFLASRKLAFASPPLPVACSLKPIANSLKPLPEAQAPSGGSDDLADADFFNRDFAAEAKSLENATPSPMHSTTPAPDALLSDWEVADRLQKAKDLGWSEERLNWLKSLGRQPIKRQA